MCIVTMTFGNMKEKLGWHKIKYSTNVHMKSVLRHTLKLYHPLKKSYKMTELWNAKSYNSIFCSFIRAIDLEKEKEKENLQSFLL